MSLKDVTWTQTAEKNPLNRVCRKVLLVPMYRKSVSNLCVRLVFVDITSKLLGIVWPFSKDQ